MCNGEIVRQIKEMNDHICRLKEELEGKTNHPEYDYVVNNTNTFETYLKLNEELKTAKQKNRKNIQKTLDDMTSSKLFDKQFKQYNELINLKQDICACEERVHDLHNYFQDTFNNNIDAFFKIVKPDTFNEDRIVVLFSNVAVPDIFNDDSIVTLFNLVSPDTFNDDIIVVLLFNIVEPDIFRVPNIDILFCKVVKPETFNEDKIVTLSNKFVVFNTHKLFIFASFKVVTLLTFNEFNNVTLSFIIVVFDIYKSPFILTLLRTDVPEIFNVPNKVKSFSNIVLLETFSIPFM
jgi:hypothetical protein